MSTTPQVAVLGAGRHVARQRRTSRTAAGVVSVLAFAALGLYGVLRWETMLAPPPVGRMLGLLGLSLAAAALGALAGSGRLRGRNDARLLAWAAIGVCALAMLPMSGLPLTWALHLRVAVTARAIGHGLSALPGVIVPLHGHDRATRAVIALGAGLLLFGGALTLAASRVPRGELRLAAAALPLVVLASVPSALARPNVAYLHGALLFALLMFLLFSERIRPAAGTGAVAAVGLAAAAALVLSPAIDSRHAWISFEKITVPGPGAGSGRGETFDWTQTYGPLLWPHTGATVLEVQPSRFPAYWKTEDLDGFDGAGWVATPVATANPLATISSETEERWSQTLTVRLAGISTSQIVAAGVAGPPLLPGDAPVQAGSEPGTYVTATPLGPGASYRVRVYTPRPSPAQLASAPGAPPPPQLASELQMQLPPAASGAARRPATVQFAAYGSGGAVLAHDGLTPAQALQALSVSPYGPVFAIAQRLRAETSTPYGYVRGVLRLLAQGYSYTQTPPVSQLPIVSFLVGDRAGYCQQFAGAMALLLRMGGVPARVATGFATGTYNPQRHAYVVADFDAHAWVEAWVDGLGWVPFDPTPPADPALGGLEQIAGQPAAPGPPHHLSPKPRPSVRRQTAGALVSRRGPRAAGLGAATVLALALIAAAALAAVVMLVVWARRPVSGAGLLAELERAFARCGRPLPPGTTLAKLEERFAGAPAAAAYVRALRLARFGGVNGPPAAEGRRAVRRALAHGLGVTGWIRALLGLPPRPGFRRPPRPGFRRPRNP